MYSVSKFEKVTCGFSDEPRPSFLPLKWDALKYPVRSNSRRAQALASQVLKPSSTLLEQLVPFSYPPAVPHNNGRCKDKTPHRGAVVMINTTQMTNSQASTTRRTSGDFSNLKCRKEWVAIQNIQVQNQNILIFTFDLADSSNASLSYSLYLPPNHFIYLYTRSLNSPQNTHRVLTPKPLSLHSLIVSGNNGILSRKLKSCAISTKISSDESSS